MNGLYEVSNMGRIKSLDKTIKLYNGGSYVRKGKILKLLKSRQGYMRIHLLINGVAKTLSVHRLVAEAFIPNPNNYKQVNHKDENKSNNNVENLEWCTQEYNKRYGTARQRMREKTSKKIIQYDLDDNFIKIWNGIREAGRNLKITNQAICLCCMGRRNKAGGYKWRYYND